MQNEKELRTEVLFAPAQIARRWRWHTESIRRKIRPGEVTALIIGPGRLVRIEKVAAGNAARNIE